MRLLLLCVICVMASIRAWAQISIGSVSQKGTCTVAGVTGNVTVNCPGIDPAVVRIIQKQFNARLKDREAQIENLTGEVNQWKDKYLDLTARLVDAGVSDGLKRKAEDLLKAGKLDEAGRVLDEVLTQRFADATQHLASKELTVRLGAIFALERMARNSARDHWAIVEILTAYIRENSPWKPSPTVDKIMERVLAEQGTTDANVSERYCSALAKDEHGSTSPPELKPDIQLVLSVLGRRVNSPDREGQTWQVLNLQGTDLQGADLRGINFDRAIFDRSNLRAVDFRNASLKNARFSYSVLVDANFAEATAEGAQFDYANAQEANFYKVVARQAKFFGTCLVHAQFGEGILENSRFKGTLLTRALFWDANLDGADFELANLGDADLSRSTVKGTDMRGAINVRQSQIDTMVKDSSTRLPSRRAPR